MDKIIDFFKKWGIMLTAIFSLCAMYNSCGVTTKLDRMNKNVISLEKNIIYNDSLDREINIIQNEISQNEIALKVVYDQNTIVRTTARPDDVMNGYTTKIKDLQDKLNKLKNARK